MTDIQVVCIMMYANLLKLSVPVSVQ